MKIISQIVFLTLAALIWTNLCQADQIPCWEYYLDMACGTEESAFMFNLPDGSGSPFTEAQRSDGTFVDCRIFLTIQDCFGVPIQGFPAEDIWIQSDDGSMVPCIGGSNPDFDTDETGSTEWVDPMFAGGSTPNDVYIMINGEMLFETPLPLHFSSADISGDGVVNLVDVGLFSNAFFGDYNFEADFFHDGHLNLADVGRLALGIGDSCP